VLARVLEGWQSGWIVNINSGAPTSITAQSMLYANGTPDIVGPFNPKDVHVQWVDGASTPTANYLPGGVYTSGDDPQCAKIAPSLQSFCTINAVFDAKTGLPVLVTPQPGKRGTLGQRAIQGTGRWRLDANLNKQVRIAETKTLQFRIDASNLFNHPEPGAPV